MVTIEPSCRQNIALAGRMDDVPMRVIKTARTALEPLTEAHAGEMFATMSDGALYAHIPDKPPTSVAMLRQRYRRLERGCPDGSQLWLNWIIRLSRGLQCVGYVQATVFSGRTADLAYVLAPAHWGCGFASEACAAAIAFLGEDLGIRSLYATASCDNHRSVRLLLGLQFKEIDSAHYPHGAVENGDRVFERLPNGGYAAG